MDPRIPKDEKRGTPVEDSVSVSIWATNPTKKSHTTSKSIVYYDARGYPEITLLQGTRGTLPIANYNNLLNIRATFIIICSPYLILSEWSIMRFQSSRIRVGK